MTRLIPRVMLFMMVVSLLFIATAAANWAPGPDWLYPDAIVPPPTPEPSTRFDYYDSAIDSIQSGQQQSHPIFYTLWRAVTWESRPTGSPAVYYGGTLMSTRFDQILRGNTSGAADGYNSDRLQDLINDFRTRV
jgi:hypothetical protein